MEARLTTRNGAFIYVYLDILRSLIECVDELEKSSSIECAQATQQILCGSLEDNYLAVVCFFPLFGFVLIKKCCCCWR